MVAVIVLILAGVFQLWMERIYYSIDPAVFEAVLSGGAEDEHGLLWIAAIYDVLFIGGIILLWIAGILTLVTGFDYFRKALPYLQEAGK